MKTRHVFQQMARLKKNQWLMFSFIGAAFLLLYMFTWPTVQQQSDTYQKIISTMPKGVISAFNISQSQPTLMGFLSSKHFGFVWGLMIIMLLISFGSSAIAREIEARTMGFLLSQPISRTRLYLGRLLAGIYGLVIFIIASEVITWPLARLFKYDVSIAEVLNIGLLGLIFGLCILGLSMLSSATASEASRSTTYMSGLMLMMYVAFLIASLEPKVDKLKYISVFHYFSPGKVIEDGHLGLQSVVVLLISGTVAATLGLIIFNRRDIQV